MTATIQLAKPYTPEKLGDKLYVSEKLDGVPIRIDMRIVEGKVAQVTARTRQNEYPISCEFVIKALVAKVRVFLECVNIPPSSWTFVGEVTHETYKDFKDVSGVVRTQTPQTGLILNLFDFWSSSAMAAPTFDSRHFAMQLIVGGNTNYVRIIKQRACLKSEFDAVVRSMFDPNTMEGLVIRDAVDHFKPGKRTWGYQKYVPDPTIDLWLYSVEEAVSSTGVPLGMVGRMNFMYHGRTVGVGPGKLSHDARKELWVKFGGLPVSDKIMACIKYKRDDSYDDLRQPTFQHWRFDKDEADA